jgi:peroxiredoxin Q/BCP
MVRASAPGGSKEDHMAVGKGDPAPDFTLPGIQDGERRDYSLADFRGQPVVLVFYPGDNTPECTRQLNTYTADIEEFAAHGAQLLGISPQSVDSHGGFADKQGGFAFPLLADEDKAVGTAYGILGPVGFYRRSVFVIDASGTITYAHRAFGGATFRPTDMLVKAVADAS